MKDFDNTQLSKKERKALKRQEKEAQNEAIKRSNALKRGFIWVGLLLILSVSVFGMMKFVSSGESGDNSEEKLNYKDSNLMTEWYMGNKDAEVVLVEYSDFQCPACAAYQPILNQLEEDLGNSVKFIYRHFPLKQIHKNAELAGAAAEAAGLQGNFWGMHDLLLENQSDWADLSNEGAKEIFIAYSEFLGLENPKFSEDLESRGVKSIVENDYQSGIKSQVNATPTFFLNGFRIQNPRSYGEFKNILENAIEEYKQ